MLPVQEDANLLVGTKIPDDAAVYRLSDELALIQTVDFFPPVVDEPYYYGQIAAANALSDVYAMGGKPLTAMNIVCFPCRKLGIEILVQILRGGAEKVTEAGALLVGGHTINDDEPKYGLAVTGVAHPGEIFTKGALEPGDRLILTKPLGAGIITTALKGGLEPLSCLEEMIHWMTALNREASEIAHQVGVRACTDITGFGLLGHAYEMVQESGCSITFYTSSVPLVEGTMDLARQGLVPGGAKMNREYLRDRIVFSAGIDELMLDILCDPQTSGGLLMAVKRDKAEPAVRLLSEKGFARSAVIGEVTLEEERKIVLK